MTQSFDVATDFLRLADGLEPVTLLRRGSSDATPTQALRVAPTTNEAAPSDGQFTAANVRWHLPQCDCPIAPRPGDIVLDAAGERFTIREVQQSPQTGRWKCDCCNLAIQHALDDTVSVEQSERVAEPSGGYRLVWRTVLTGLRARIQPWHVAVHAEVEPPQSVKKTRIYLAQEFPLDHRHRIRAANGQLYRVTAYTAATELDSLPIVDTEDAE